MKNFIILDPDIEEVYATDDADLYEKIKKYNNKEGGALVFITKPNLEDDAIDATELANDLGLLDEEDDDDQDREPPDEEADEDNEDK